jgi:hypothetical protein
MVRGKVLLRGFFSVLHPDTNPTTRQHWIRPDKADS